MTFIQLTPKTLILKNNCQSIDVSINLSYVNMIDHFLVCTLKLHPISMCLIIFAFLSSNSSPKLVDPFLMHWFLCICLPKTCCSATRMACFGSRWLVITIVLSFRPNHSKFPSLSYTHRCFFWKKFVHILSFTIDMITWRISLSHPHTCPHTFSFLLPFISTPLSNHTLTSNTLQCFGLD